mgnify:CR=1 FL=1
MTNIYLKNAAILTAASLVLRAAGMGLRVLLAAHLGSEGMGLYQLVLPIYALAWSITSAGFTTTISHLAAQEYIRGQNGNKSSGYGRFVPAPAKRQGRVFPVCRGRSRESRSLPP